MHKEILSKKQADLLPVIKSFAKDFGLVGGTAIALHIGHRESVDFDLFTNVEFDNSKIRRKLVGQGKKIEHVFQDNKDEYSILVDGVKITFFYYPFKIKFSKKFSDIIGLPDLLTLGAMKAYALGRRAKWKDYVDIYFINRDYHNVDKLVKTAKQIFKSEFNEKIFRSQLAYFNDIDYSEKVIFHEGFDVDDKTIQTELKKLSI